MTLTRIWLLFAIGAITIVRLNVATAAAACTTETRLPVSLHLATSPKATAPTAAYLIGDLTPGLRIVDAASGRLLWTAGASGAFTQTFSGMTAGFTSSLAAIDTDGDGAHDRFYAGDLQGRLWRFDIGPAPVASWVSGGIFADLSAGAPGRGFLAAPDLTFIAPEGLKPWLSIALGSANTAMTESLNRFYVLRDRAPFEPWTQRQYDLWTPLTQRDLGLAEGKRMDVTAGASEGFYINLGANQVVAPALTLDGQSFYSVVNTTASLLPACDAPTAPAPVIVNVGSIAAVDGSLQAMDLGEEILRSTPANSAVVLQREENSQPATSVCTVNGHRLPGCSFDSTLRRSFWRREDAD